MDNLLFAALFVFVVLFGVSAMPVAKHVGPRPDWREYACTHNLEICR